MVVGPVPGGGLLHATLHSSSSSTPNSGVAFRSLSNRQSPVLNLHRPLLNSTNDELSRKLRRKHAKRSPLQRSRSSSSHLVVPLPAVQLEQSQGRQLHSKSDSTPDDTFTDSSLAKEPLRPASEPAKARSRRQCPSCQPPLGSASETERQLADEARLESIKRQILVKLGMHVKPNVTTVPSRDFILETLLRAEESLESESAKGHDVHPETGRDSETTTVDGVEDDFFGKTSEIIAFAEQGKHSTLFPLRS